MFQGFSERGIGFLWGIRFNNNKPWFEEHKQDFKTYVEVPMKELAAYITENFCQKHPELGLSVKVSRIYRDARRLFGRGPYKDHLWLSVFRKDDTHIDRPSFWFEISPETFGYGIGFWQPRPETMAKHRRRIDDTPERVMELEALLQGRPEFLLFGEEYKRPQRLTPPGPLSRWYNRKGISIVYDEKMGPAIESPDIAKRVVEAYEYLLPVYGYLATLPYDPDPVTGELPQIEKTR